MKKILLLLSSLLMFSSIYAQHNIEFKFRIRFQANQYVWSTITIVDSSSFLEGASYTIPEFTMPDAQSYLQSAYNALVGATFGIDEGAINNDIRLVITLNGLNLNGNYLNPINNAPLFLILDVDVYDPADSPEPVSGNFWFNTGHAMTFEIPFSDDFIAFVQGLNLSPNALSFAYITATEFLNDNITTHLTLNSISFSAEHLSSFGGGSENLVSVQKENDTSIPTKYALAQNYPNPFNPSTKIEFSIPEKNFITLKVYNALGVEVASLISEDMPAGNYSYDFNAKNLPSGIYFYSLNGNGISLTKKMILLK